MLYTLRVDLQVQAEDGDQAIEDLNQALVGSGFTVLEVLAANGE